MRGLGAVLIGLFLLYSCDFRELRGGGEGLQKFIGADLPQAGELNSEDKNQIYQLCDSFQRKSIGLSREKSPNYFFSIEESKCDGQKKQKTIGQKIKRKSNGDFEFVGDGENFYFKNVETHEQGMFKEMCRLLIFSVNHDRVKINNFVDLPSGKERISYQIKKNSDDSIDFILYHGKKKEKNGMFKVYEVEHLNFLVETRGMFGEGTLVERSFVKECPYGSLQKLTNFSSILEKIAY